MFRSVQPSRATVRWTVAFRFVRALRTNKKREAKATLFLLVPLTGLEPVRLLQQGILSPWCLPIPPQRQVALFYHDLPLPSSRSEAKGKVFWGRITTQRPMHGKGLFAGAAEPSGFCTQGGNDATGSLYIAQKIQHHQFSVLPSHCG